MALTCQNSPFEVIGVPEIPLIGDLKNQAKGTGKLENVQFLQQEVLLLLIITLQVIGHHNKPF